MYSVTKAHLFIRHVERDARGKKGTSTSNLQSRANPPYEQRTRLYTATVRTMERYIGLFATIS